ncbi:MAG: SDR family oxidoreductase [Actinobacteria bacterium]|nr:SDR family oxidoreductase [Actinomycetota bacterium]
MTQSRSALVTGASRGIGAEVARALSAQGYRVAVHYSSSLGSAQAVHAELDGDGHVVVRADLRDPEQVQAMVDEVAAQFGTIDVLVNNAGVFFAHPIDEVDYQTWQEAWRETLDVNLVGPANVTWCAVRHMGPGGRIINVGSRGAFRGEPHSPAYGASKAAIAAFGQSLARYLGGRGIAVTTIAPGFVETDMATEALAGEGGVVRRAESPFNRVATTDDIAAAVVYLASSEAEWASGGILDLNGASYLRM